MTYAEDHAGALRDVRDAGSRVVFWSEVAGEHDPLTETFGDTTREEVPGYAVEVKPSESEMTFESDRLVEGQRVVFLFVPDAMGQLPKRDMMVEYVGTEFSVAERWPLRPAGEAILARVLVVR